MDTTTKPPKARVGRYASACSRNARCSPMFPTHTTADGPPRSTPGDNTYYCVKGAPLCSGCRGCRATGNSSHGMSHHESVLRRLRPRRPLRLKLASSTDGVTAAQIPALTTLTACFCG